MITPCEVAVKSVIPAVKALMANELVEKHGMRQSQVAELLGISQSAVSKYSKKVRGCMVKIDNVEEIDSPVGGMIALVTKGAYERMDFLKLFCQACVAVRRKGLMCECCQKAEPEVKMEHCSLCLVERSDESER